jgi:predicted nucleic acid-binding protein
MNLYLDTSALAKRYVREAGTEDVRGWVDQAERIATSLISWAEIVAALARLVRMGVLIEDEAEAVLALLRTHWPMYIRTTIDEHTIKRAGELAWTYGLRGYDAVQLASAELWQGALRQPITLVTYDRQLAEAGRRLGLAVHPETW